jgi:hypothetical protein
MSLDRDAARGGASVHAVEEARGVEQRDATAAGADQAVAPGEGRNGEQESFGTWVHATLARLGRTHDASTPETRSQYHVVLCRDVIRIKTRPECELARILGQNMREPLGTASPSRGERRDGASPALDAWNPIPRPAARRRPCWDARSRGAYLP